MSVINLDEVGTLCLPSCLCLSPNLVLNDPFPLFYQPIFYPLDHVQYGWFFMQMSGGWNGGQSRAAPATDCLLPYTAETFDKGTAEQYLSFSFFPRDILSLFLPPPSQVAQICKSQRELLTINATATWCKIAPTLSATSSFFPGCLTDSTEDNAI